MAGKLSIIGNCTFMIHFNVLNTNIFLPVVGIVGAVLPPGTKIYMSCNVSNVKQRNTNDSKLVESC